MEYVPGVVFKMSCFGVAKVVTISEQFEKILYQFNAEMVMPMYRSKDDSVQWFAVCLCSFLIRDSLATRSSSMTHF